MFRKKKLAKEVIAEHAALQSVAQSAEALHTAFVKAIDGALAQTIRQIESDSTAAIQRANTELEKVRQNVIAAVQMATNTFGLAGTPWTASAWNNHTPPTVGSLSTVLRLGELRPNHIATRLPPMPALLPLVGQRHVLVSFEDALSHTGAEILQSLAWRIAALSPPASYRFVLLDPLDRGTNLASLLKLPESLRGPKIACQDSEIEEALQQLVSDIEEVIQRRLLNTYPNIEAYNAANLDVAVPYRFLIAAGFPKGFTSRAADLLLSIARTGRRAGCYLLGGVLREEKLPHDFDFAALMKLSTFVTVKGRDRLEWNDSDFTSFPILPDLLPPAGLIDRLAAAIQPLAVASASTIIPFSRIAIRKAHWWQTCSADGMTVPVGIDESGGVYEVAIGQGLIHHALVGGATSSGKTNLLHLLVLMLSTRYSPDELEMYLVDFKSGVEFQDYATYALPHARAVVLEAEREFGLSILQHLVDEMERRSQDFKMAGVADIENFRTRTDQAMPRILLIVDEYVVLFSEDDRLATRAGEALAALVMRGRSYGIHVLLSAQRPASTFLSMANIRNQMGLRIALKCRPEDSILILGEGNDRAARLSKAGESCITMDPDRLDATAQVRVTRLTPDERALYLRGLQAFAHLKTVTRRAPLIVFSRDGHILWAENSQIRQRLDTLHWTLPPAPFTWLGQPLRIAEDITITLDCQQATNLLILGSDESLAYHLLLSAVQGLCLTASPKTARFLIVGAVDPRQPYSRVLTALQSEMPHMLELCARQEAVDALLALAEELDNRLNMLPARPEQTVFLVVAGLHRWQEARSSDPFGPSQAGEYLVRLCQQGPEVGIHTLMWCDRLSSIGTTVGRGAQHDILAYFGHRIALQMTSDESMNLLGVPFAAKLGSERAYYRNEQWSADVLEKFKPYALLSSSEVHIIASRVKRGWTAT